MVIWSRNSQRVTFIQTVEYYAVSVCKTTVIQRKIISACLSPLSALIYPFFIPLVARSLLTFFLPSVIAFSFKFLLTILLLHAAPPLPLLVLAPPFLSLFPSSPPNLQISSTLPFYILHFLLLPGPDLPFSVSYVRLNFGPLS